MNDCDYLIIGAGIVGLATALELCVRHPERKVWVIEKEKQPARHQTGRNSGVIHSGIYYRPGSLKAKNCVAGMKYLLDFCRENNVPFKITGKLIVATEEAELERLQDLYHRGQENGLSGLEVLEFDAMREIEPHVGGIRAVWVPATGIIDYKVVCSKFVEIIRERGGSIIFGRKVKKIKPENDHVKIITGHQVIQAGYAINCAGLYCDQISRLAGLKPEIKIIPFRGEYYKLTEESTYLTRGLIYPVPDPAFPFLGVHFTKMIDGSVEIGPNAVLAFKKEGYKKTSFSTKESWSTLSYPGLWKLAGQFWRKGIEEMARSFNKRLFVADTQRLVPTVKSRNLIPHKAGVRAQALTKTGALCDDFAMEYSPRMTHVLNAPSPAATASLAIAKTIVDETIVRQK